MYKKYICIKQHDQKDCGVACLATVSKTYGLKVDQKEKTTYLDLKLHNKYGVLKKDENVILLLENICNDIIQSIK